uniref:Interleukin 10 receptor, alpha n=2 Tax=Astyanax mexicanus TaxID=7994 RepID=A0A3B1KFK0_ASTMX
MDRNSWVLTLVMFLTMLVHVSGSEMKPQNVTVHIWEGNVTVTWDPPQKNPQGCRYTVQVATYIDYPRVWTNVTNCNLIHGTVCNIGTLFNESEERLVKVYNHMAHGSFSSGDKRFNIKHSLLLPPSFTLQSTPYTVQVKMQRKQLPGVFPFGLDYTAYLWPQGRENETLSDDDTDEDGEIKFSSLDRWQVYCVRVQVKSTTGPSNISPAQCTQIPLDVAVIIYFVFLGLLGFVAVLMIFVCCFLRRSVKMPKSLKPMVSSWQPMSVGSDHVETVTDKGWHLFINKNEEKRQTSEAGLKCPEEDKEWRESLDSGMGMEHLDPSVKDTKCPPDGQTEDVQEDSGCGSLKGTEGSGSIQRTAGEFVTLDVMSRDSGSEGREDSGLGMGHREVSSSLEGEDSGLLSEVVVVGDGYRSQSPSSVDVQKENPESCDMETNMAAPSDGYRCGQVMCSCLEQEYCVWCKFKKPLTEDCQSVTQVQTDSRLLICVSVDEDFGDTAVSNYRKKTLMQTVNLFGMEETVCQPAFHHLDMTPKTSPFFFSSSLLQHNGENRDCITEAHSFTLEDVKLVCL